MALATKNIASGILAEAKFHDSRWFTVVSQTSDWFESLVGSGQSGDANFLAVSIVIGKVTIPGGTGHESLILDLYESEDLKEWGHVASLTTSSPAGITTPSIYSATYTYPTSPRPKKYFKIQFNLEDPEIEEPNPTIPYPNLTVEFEGTCWVTVTESDV